MDITTSCNRRRIRAVKTARVVVPPSSKETGFPDLPLFSDEMSRFINSNPGLKSRFSRSIHFEDYDPVELTEIFKLLCNKNSYALDDVILSTFRELVSEFTDLIGELGNGRFVRNIFDRCIANQCNRLAAMLKPAPEDLKTFLTEDVPDRSQLIQYLA